MSRFVGNQSLKSVLQRTANCDPDFRNQALQDLREILESKDPSLESNAARVRSCLQDRITDKLPQVREKALECLNAYVPTASSPEILSFTEHLFGVLKDNADQELRDVACTALAGMIESLPTPHCPEIAAECYAYIGGYLKDDTVKNEVKGNCLDLISHLLSRAECRDHCENVSDLSISVRNQLSSGSAKNRRMAESCIGGLAKLMPNNTLADCINNLLKDLKSSDRDMKRARSFVVAFTEIADALGSRMNEWLDEAVPQLLSRCTIDLTSSKGDDMEDDEMKELCLQACETLLLKCPRKVAQYAQQIKDASLSLITYDPNYAGDDDGDTEMADVGGAADDDDDWGADDDDDDGFGEAEDFEDDEEENIEQVEDNSWKVRLAASKALAALINTRPQLLSELVVDLSPVLIRRIRTEREENALLEVLHTVRALLSQTYITTKGKGLSTIDESLPKLVKALDATSVKTDKSQTSALSVMGEAVSASRQVSSVLNDVVALALKSLDGSQPSLLQLEALRFLRRLFSSFSESDVSVFEQSLLGSIARALSSALGRNTTAVRALSSCEAFANVLSLRNSNDLTEGIAEISSQLFSPTVEILKNTDVDQSVKIAAIQCVCAFVAKLGPVLGDQACDDALSVLVDRLDNELTRLACVKGLAFIAEESDQNLSKVRDSIIPSVLGFLRLNDRTVRHEALKALHLIVRQAGIASNTSGTFVEDVGAFVDEDDVYATQLAFICLAAALSSTNTAFSPFCKSVYPRILTVIRSPLLRGHPLTALMDLYATILSCKHKSLKFDKLVRDLSNIAVSVTDNSVLSSIAECIATLTINGTKKERAAAIAQYTKNSDDILSLYCLGKIGKRSDLSGQENVFTTLMEQLNSKDNSVQEVASDALGNLAVGNIKFFLPLILESFTEDQTRAYLLLRSLRETLASAIDTVEGCADLRPHAEDVIPLLFKNCGKGHGFVVAECLGRLVRTHPQQLLPVILARSNDPDASVRIAVVSSLTFVILGEEDGIDTALAAAMASLQERLQDGTPEVKLAALRTFKFIVSKQPDLLKNDLDKCLPLIYNSIKVDPSGIKEKQMGIFTLIMDDGLLVRRAGFECMMMLLEQFLDQLDIHNFIEKAVTGLEDPAYTTEKGDKKQYIITALQNPAPGVELRLNVLSIVRRLSRRCGSALVAFLPTIAPNLTKIVKMKFPEKDAARMDPLITSAIRCALTLSLVPGADNCKELSVAISQIKEAKPEEFGSVSKAVTTTVVDALTTSTGASLRQSQQS